MCGIGGFMRFGDQPITHDQIKAMLLKLQERGGHATGVATVGEDYKTINVHKADKMAWNFLTDQKTEEFLDKYVTPKTQIVLCHTRFATKGEPNKNENNHPMFAGKAAVVHNGHISNDDFLFGELKLERKAETDSDIIRAIVDKEGLTKESIRRLNRMSGACASAIVHPEFPGKLMLLRSGSPLVVARQGDLLMWASTKEAITLAARSWQEWKGMWFQSNGTGAGLMFNPMEKETAWIIDREKGLEWHEEFRSAARTYTPRTSYPIHEVHAAAEAKKVEKEEPFVVTTGPLQLKKTDGILFVCRNLNCRNKETGERQVLDLKKFTGFDLADLQCPSCKVPLAESRAS
jgi:predicted glutamine amidotransferase